MKMRVTQLWSAVTCRRFVTARHVSASESADLSVHSKSSSLRKFFALAALALFIMPTSLFACVSCYGRSDSSLAVGMNWGIFTLLAVIGGVLVTFAGFFIYIVRRQNAFAKMAEQNLPEDKV